MTAGRKKAVAPLLRFSRAGAPLRLANLTPPARRAERAYQGAGNVKKSVVSLLLVLALASGVSIAGAQEGATDPVAQLTGAVWQKTSPDNKAAFLFGMDTAIAVEYAVNGKLTESAAAKGKTPVSTLSPFEKAWGAAFKNMSRRQIIQEVDDWYAKNPGELDRPVMNVLWYQVIQPRVASQK